MQPFTLLLLFGVLALSRAAVPLFSATFEDGSYTGWTPTVTNNGYSIDITSTTAAISTTKSLHIKGGSGTPFDGFNRSFGSSAVTPGYISFWVRASASNTNGLVVMLGNGATVAQTVAEFRMRNDGQMGITDATTGNLVGTSYSANVWYNIVLQITYSSSFSVQLWIDSAKVGNAVKTRGGTAINAIYIFNLNNQDSWFDQLYLNCPDNCSGNQCAADGSCLCKQSCDIGCRTAVPILGMNETRELTMANSLFSVDGSQYKDGVMMTYSWYGYMYDLSSVLARQFSCPANAIGATWSRNVNNVGISACMIDRYAGSFNMMRQYRQNDKQVAFSNYITLSAVVPVQNNVQFTTSWWWVSFAGEDQNAFVVVVPTSTIGAAITLTVTSISGRFLMRAVNDKYSKCPGFTANYTSTTTLDFFGNTALTVSNIPPGKYHVSVSERVSNSLNTAGDILVTWSDCTKTCKNGGVCWANKCVCTSKFEGADCSTPKCGTTDSTCSAHGSCNRTVGATVANCVCGSGYYGLDCECATTVIGMGNRTYSVVGKRLGAVLTIDPSDPAFKYGFALETSPGLSLAAEFDAHTTSDCNLPLNNPGFPYTGQSDILTYAQPPCEVSKAKSYRIQGLFDYSNMTSGWINVKPYPYNSLLGSANGYGNQPYTNVKNLQPDELTPAVFRVENKTIVNGEPDAFTWFPVYEKNTKITIYVQGSVASQPYDYVDIFFSLYSQPCFDSPSSLLWEGYYAVNQPYVAGQGYPQYTFTAPVAGVYSLKVRVFRQATFFIQFYIDTVSGNTVVTTPAPTPAPTPAATSAVTTTKGATTGATSTAAVTTTVAATTPAATTTKAATTPAATTPAATTTKIATTPASTTATSVAPTPTTPTAIPSTTGTASEDSSSSSSSSSDDDSYSNSNSETGPSSTTGTEAPSSSDSVESTSTGAASASSTTVTGKTATTSSKGTTTTGSVVVSSTSGSSSGSKQVIIKITVSGELTSSALTAIKTAIAAALKVDISQVVVTAEIQAVRAVLATSTITATVSGLTDAQLQSQSFNNVTQTLLSSTQFQTTMQTNGLTVSAVKSNVVSNASSTTATSAAATTATATVTATATGGNDNIISAANGLTNQFATAIVALIVMLVLQY